jgi:DNA-directed RNA polymerase specialized sigma24 family protein
VAGADSAFQRIAHLLALILVKGESETQKVLTLTAVGYSTGEIAQLLGKQSNTVSVILYKAKQDAKPKKTR